MKWDTEATKQAAWELLVSRARGWVRAAYLSSPAVKAAFFAGWEAHENAVARAEKEQRRGV